MTFILLTGAGFSRNWGGWLANEAFEYLLGCREIDEELRARLWSRRAKGNGFEDALADLQAEYQRTATETVKKQLQNLQNALAGMFNAMDQAFANTTFEPQNNQQYLIRTFLARFDAIFTLNQDLLLERHYLDNNIMLSSTGKQRGWQIPGVKLLNPTPPAFDSNLVKVAHRTPDSPPFREDPGHQPYFKLHGSSNWFSDDGQRLLVMGGNKKTAIDQHPLLHWYHRKFDEYLARQDVRLMVIGYSFSDAHINNAIVKAANGGGLRLFIIDPQGVDLLNKQPASSPMKVKDLLENSLNPYVIGASRRSLTNIFGTDRVEHSKVMRFFEK